MPARHKPKSLFMARIFHTAFSFLSATRYHINGGILLIITAVVAMLLANSPWSTQYFEFFQQPIALQIGSFNLFSHGGHPLTLTGFINDALMAIFFFSVGLEIKREILVGELSNLRQALLPIIAAVGGMIVPVLLFALLTRGTPGATGLAIPMATDIAFSLGVLSLFGRRVPLSLKVFLTAFAVVDDIGGILVIALFYSSHLSPGWLLAGAGVLIVLIVANLCNIRRRWLYLWLGMLLWYLFMQSGVHATIAGVIVAFTIPATPGLHVEKYISRIRTQINSFDLKHLHGKLLSKPQISRLKAIESASDRVISPLQSLEDDLHAMVNYAIMPLFALANAGVSIQGDQGLSFGTLSTAIVVGLVVGKFLGILLFTLLAVRLKWSDMPEGMNLRNLCGIAMLGGIGFTVSLFIANLSFEATPALLAEAKLGVVCGTLLAGLAGAFILHFTLRKKA